MGECTRCKSIVADTALQCPSCGIVLAQAPPPKSQEAKLFIRAAKQAREQQSAEFKSNLYRGIAVVLMFGFLVAARSVTNSSSTKSERTTAKLEAVYNSAWDGSVRQVEQYLKRNLKDPNSLQVMEWSPVIKTGSGFVVSVRYRAKNSFGGFVVKSQEFNFDSAGGIVQVYDLN